MSLVITILCATIGGVILLKLRVPGGMLVGAIIGATVYSILSGNVTVMTWEKVSAQIITGSFIGCMVSKDQVRKIPQILKPYIIAMGSLLCLNIVIGFTIYKITELDKLTSLFCAMPGGMTDTPLVAMDMGADSGIVAVMQFVRMLFGMACLPSLIALSEGNPMKKTGRNMSKERKEINAKAEIKAFLCFLPVLFIATAAGILGRKSGVPAATLASAMLITAIMRIYGKAPAMPKWLRRLAQILSGSCIGGGVTMQQLKMLRSLILPAAILCVGYACVSFGVGLLIYRLFQIEKKEAMLYLAPAGASEMALIAADMGIQSPNLAILQICRLIGVTIVFPQIFTLLL